MKNRAISIQEIFDPSSRGRVPPPFITHPPHGAYREFSYDMHLPSGYYTLHFTYLVTTKSLDMGFKKDDLTYRSPQHNERSREEIHQSFRDIIRVIGVIIQIMMRIRELYDVRVVSFAGDVTYLSLIKLYDRLSVDLARNLHGRLEVTTGDIHRRYDIHLPLSSSSASSS